MNARVKLAAVVAVTGAHGGGGYRRRRRQWDREFADALHGLRGDAGGLDHRGRRVQRDVSRSARTGFSYRLGYAGLEGNVTQAHIHFGQKSVTGGVSVFLCSNLGTPGRNAGLPDHRPRR